MTFTEYQNQTAKTAIYPDQGTLTGVLYCALGLTGEAGEVAGKLKKILRDNNGIISDERRFALASEIGDSLWYLAQLANELSLDLNDIAVLNLEKLADRAKRGVIGGSGDKR